MRTRSAMQSLFLWLLTLKGASSLQQSKWGPEAASLKQQEVRVINQNGELAHHSDVAMDLERSTPQQRSERPLDLSVGGKVGNDLTTQGNRDKITAPEVKTSMRLTDDGWEPCATTENKDENIATNICWYGTGLKDLEVKVPDQEYQAVAFEVHFKCDSGGGFIRHTTHALRNGELDVSFNGELKTTKDSSTIGAIPDTGVRDDWNFDDVGDDVVIRVEFRPKAKNARAKVKLLAMKVTGEFGQCVLFKKGLTKTAESGMCASKLGHDGDIKALKLRSDEKRQRECLEKGPPGDCDNPIDACESFSCCLGQTGRSILDDILDVALSGDSSLIQSKPHHEAKSHRSLMRSEKDKADFCVDPSSADPESWGCDCYDKWSAQCDTTQAGTKRQECLKSVWCSHGKVCDSWKTASGCASLLQQRAQRAPSTKAADGALDESMSDKCLR